MTSQGHRYAQFQRALKTGSAHLALAAAAECFLFTEIRQDVHTAVSEVERSAVEIVGELRRVHEHLDRLSVAFERRRTVTRQDRAA